MADLIEIKVSASIDDTSLNQMKQTLNNIGKEAKPKIDMDSKDANKKIKEVESSLLKLGQNTPKISLIDETAMRMAGVEFEKFEGKASDSARSITKNYSEMSGVIKDSTKIQGQSFNEVTGELEKFTVSVDKSGGVTKKFTHQLVEMEDGTKAWVQTSVKGTEDIARAFKRVEQDARKLLTVQKQLEAVKHKAEGLDKQSDEYKKIMTEVTKLESETKKYQNAAEQVSDIDMARLQKGVKKVGDETDVLVRKTKELQQVQKITVGELGSQMEQTGRSLVRLSAPVVALGGAAIKMQVDYESAFAGVRKTVDATEEQFASLSTGIRELGKTYPQTATEIAGIVEIAGQLGVKQEDILDFSEVMIMLGDSTNMASEQAADLLARFTNITGMDISNMDRLGATIVDLGNNFATTETEIVDMSTRLASAGKQVGMSEAEIMGLSTALSSVGLKAQLGGTAFSKIMINMANASTLGVGKMQELEKATGISRRELELMSSNDKGGFKDLAQSIGMTTKEMDNLIKQGRDLEKFGKIAGTTGAEFAKAFEEDAIGAIAMFIEGLAKAEEGGETTLELLDELGIREVRLRDTLLRAGGAQELFNEAIETGTRAWDENVALVEEAEERYKTNASKLKVLKSRVQEVGITLGETLAPALLGILERVVELVEGFSKLPVEVQAGIVKFAALTTVIGTVMTVGGRLLRGGGKFFGFFKTLTGLISGTTKLTKEGGDSILGFTASVGKLTGAQGVLVAVALGGIALVAKKIYDSVKQAKEEKAELDRMAQEIPEIIVGHQKDIDYLSGMKTEFQRLNPLVGENGDLSKMTADEQARYIDIVKKLKEMIPELEVYYNKNGDMIANNKTDIEELIELKKEQMRVDRELAAQGLEGLMEDGKKASKKRKETIEDLEKQRDIRQEMIDSGKRAVGMDRQGNISYKNLSSEEIAKEVSKVEEYNAKIAELNKDSQSEIKELQKAISANLDLIGMDFDILSPRMSSIKNGFADMLMADHSAEGIENIDLALEKTQLFAEQLQQFQDGKLDLKDLNASQYISDMTDLGMVYGDISKAIYGSVVEIESGGEAVELLNTLMSENGKVSEETADKIRASYGDVEGTFEDVDYALVSLIGKTDKNAAAYLASLMVMEEGIEDFQKAVVEQFKGLGTADVVSEKQTKEQLGKLQTLSDKTLGIYKRERDDHLELIRVQNEELGTMSDEQRKKEEENTQKTYEFNRDAAIREKERKNEELLTMGQAIRESTAKQIENFVELDKKSEKFTEDFNAAWSSLGKDEKKLIVDSSEIDTSKKGWQELMYDWMNSDPKAHMLSIIDDGIKMALENTENLGVEWSELKPDQIMFVAKVLAEGLDEFDDFEKTWAGMTDDERLYHFAVQNEGIEDTEEFQKEWEGMTDTQKEFFLDLKSHGIENIPAFKEEWDKLPDEDKEMLINVLTSGVEDMEQLQSDWDNNLHPDKKRFLAEMFGAKDVQDADNETMSQWISNIPELKEFIARQGGLENVRVERSKTDGQWELKIHDKTYKATTEGIKGVGTLAESETRQWNKQKPNVITYTTKRVTEWITKVFGNKNKPANNWTGDKNFKGGLSYVGEKGRELLVYPDGSHDMTGDTTELRNLPKGTRIYNNKDTEGIMTGTKTPKFAKGNTKADEYRATYDRYTGIDNNLSKQNTLLARNNELQAQAIGNLTLKVQLIKHEIQLEKQHQKVIEGKLSIQRAERAELEKKLRRQGFKFGGSGDNREITNLKNIAGKSKEVEDMYNRYNELQFNLIPGLEADRMAINTKIQTALSKGFEQQKRINNAMRENNHLLEVNRINQARATDDIDRRIHLMKTEQKLLQEQAKLKRGEADLLRNERNQLEALLKKEGLRFSGGGDSKVVVNPENIKGKVLEVEEALDRFHEIQFELLPSFVIDGMQLQDAINAIKTDIANDIIDSQFKSDDRGVSDLQRNTERLKKLRTSIQVEDGSGRDKQLLDRIIDQEVERSKKAYDLSWKYIQQLKDHEEGSDEWYKLRDKADDYMEMSEQIDRELSELRAERLAVELKGIDTLLEAEKDKQKDLTYQMNMLDDEDEKTKERKLKISQEILESEIQYNQILSRNVSDLKKQLKGTSYNTDEWHALNDAVKEYEGSLKDSNLQLKSMNEGLIETAREIAQVNHDSKLEVAERYFFEGKTEEEARKALDDKIKAQKEFIDGEEKLLEIERIIKFINDENLAITQEQDDLLGQGDKLERAKLDRLEKELSIQQQQAKLSNLEKQKTIRQLKKNTDGSFGFEYVADQKAIRDTQENLLQAKKDLIDWERNYANEQDQKAFEEKQDRLKEEQKRLEDSLEQQNIAIKEFYDGILKMNQLFTREMDGTTALKNWGEALSDMSPVLDELGVSVGEMMEELDGQSERYLESLFEILGVGNRNDLFKDDFDFDAILKRMRVSTEKTLGGNKAGMTPREEQLYLQMLAKANTRNLKETEKMLKEQQMFNSRNSQPENMDSILQRAYAQAFNAMSNAATGATRKLVGVHTSGVSAPRLPKAPAIGRGIGNTAQNFNISKLEFPNVRDARDIEKAITSLPTFATQWANKK